MKKFKNMYAYGAAALLVGSMAFTSCSSDEEVANTNPTYNGETVKTQFAINIPYAKKTRMSADNTQQAGNKFLGMNNIRLVPYAAPATPDEWDGNFNKVLALSQIDAADGASDVSKIYSDVEIPVRTKNFLFYGEGPTTDKKENGALTADIDGKTKIADISFSLNNIIDDATTMEDGAAAWVILLNNVKNAEAGGKKWAEYAAITTTPGNAQTLKNTYNQYVTLEAGSARSIKCLMNELYSKLKDFANASGSEEEQVADAVLQAITANGLLKVEDDKIEFATDKPFPADLFLPDGVARVKVEDGAFKADINMSDYSTGLENLNVLNVTYPSSLYYHTNSALRASNDATQTFPAASDWKGYDWAGFTDTEVTATTRKIAMTEVVQYAVGLLKTTIKLGSYTLIDHGNNTITFSDSPFEMTGILIGGQPNKVGWDMYTANDATLTKTIYDAVMPSVKNISIAEDAAPNYTLALDNSRFKVDGTRDDKGNQNVVNVAIEMINNSGKSFEGRDGTIYDGSKFYLLAKLPPSEGGDVATEANPSVFMQDYMTTANFTITSLKNAYNVIPDLRSTNLEFGLAVNLEWQTGLNFNINIGDGE